MPIPFALRNWTVGENLCPPDILNAAPDGYGEGCASLVLGGVPADVDDIDAYLLGRLADIQSRLGLTPEAAATACVRMAGGFLWTVYWDPTGQVTPASQLPPPQ